MLELLAAMAILLGKMDVALAKEYSNVPIYQEIYATTSAYTDIETCKGKCINAIGKESQISDVACPRNIKLGTRVEIDKITYFCNDRTHRKYEGRFDIFMGYGEGAYKKALEYGVQRKIIRIYD